MEDSGTWVYELGGGIEIGSAQPSEAKAGDSDQQNRQLGT